MARTGSFGGPSGDYGVPLSVKHPANNQVKETVPTQQTQTLDQQLDALAKQAAQKPTPTK
jgi:hypothetical protein